MPFRNPVVVLFVTLVEATVLSVGLLVPLLVLRRMPLQWEVPFFYSVAALAFAGGFSGRTGTFGFVAFPIGFIGAFVGYTSFTALVAPPLNYEFSVIYGAIAAVSGWMVATWRTAGLRRNVQLESDDKRRCRACGVRVGIKAKRCWSCRASLNRII